MNAPANAKSVAVLLAAGCEETEAVTVIDLLRRAGMRVLTLGLTPGPVVASRGVTLIPDALLADHEAEPFDLVVLPGGAEGAARLSDDARVIGLLQRTAQSGGWVAALCAAPKVLDRAGLLSGKRATSYPGHLDPSSGHFTYVEDPVVVDGKLVTSRGPGTALDFALTLIHQLDGYSVRRKVEDALMRPA